MRVEGACKGSGSTPMSCCIIQDTVYLVEREHQIHCTLIADAFCVTIQGAVASFNSLSCPPWHGKHHDPSLLLQNHAGMPQRPDRQVAGSSCIVWDTIEDKCGLVHAHQGQSST